jgi:hypothetical protein
MAKEGLKGRGLRLGRKGRILALGRGEADARATGGTEAVAAGPVKARGIPASVGGGSIFAVLFSLEDGENVDKLFPVGFGLTRAHRGVRG